MNLTRIRWLFAGLAALVAVAGVALVDRALEVVEADRIASQDAVAERLFDEMERVLSALVAAEEARPAEHYHFAGARADTPIAFVSPLRRIPRDPYILGYFEVTPEGETRTPLLPRDDQGRVLAGATPDTLSRARELERVATLWRAISKAERSAPGRRAFSAQTAGTTIDVEQDRDLGERPSASNSPLRALNYAIKERTKVRELENARARARAQVFDPRLPFDFDTSGVTETGPLAGRRVDAGHLVLHRTVLIRGRGFVQGVVVLLPALEERLRDALDDAGASLSGARLVFRAAMPPPEAQDERQYRHRFAEPFSGLTATLFLPQLPSTASSALVYLLSLALLGIGAIGLLALYRMVRVALEFAERRSNFAAAVSHELKTPLTSIRMYAEMLREGMVPSEEKRDAYYAALTAESERLTRLIDNVLEFSRLEKGQHELRVTAGDIVPAVAGAVELMKPHAAEHGLDLAMVPCGELSKVRFDADAVVQILFNLIENAVKYGGRGERARIEVVCRETASVVSVSVRDFGPGVEPTHLGKIFEPFYRAQNELTRSAKGTGIGLALVTSLAAAMGATVSAHNRDPADGGGLEVSIALPKSA